MFNPNPTNYDLARYRSADLIEAAARDRRARKAQRTSRRRTLRAVRIPDSG